MIGVLAKNWWALAIRGVVAILFGLVALFDSGIALYALVILFGAYALVDGVFNVIAAVRAAENHQRWGWLVFSGFAGILAGLVTFLWPNITALILLYVIAYWAIVTGILELIAGFRLRGHVANEWALLLGGAASIVFGVILIVHPLAGALAVLWLIGIYAIIFGVLMLVLSFRLRHHVAGATT
ncbi:MAG TPA: HdeD family acid-resistance protein [bacterium]|nr:HdeD family acid-resistance protein [bacterium]